MRWSRRWIVVAIGLCLVGCSSPEQSSEPPVTPTRAPLEFNDISDLIAVDQPRGRGVALVDFDGDFWPDVTVSTQEAVVRFRNRGDGTFEPFGDPLELEFVQAVTWVDVDGDSDLDLYLTAHGTEHRLYRNDGAGNLTDITSDSGIGAQAVGAQGANFADIDGDGDLDLFVATGPLPHDLRVGGEQAGTSGGPNRLYFNDGTGRFTLAEGAVVGRDDGETFQGVFFDYDDDNDMDLFVVDDFIPDLLLENDGSGSFSDVSADVFPGGGLVDTSAMGVAVADVDGDGGLEVYATQRGADLLYRVDPDEGGLQDQWVQYLGNGYDPTQQLTGWGVALVDFDNDGDVDVLQTSNFETVFDPGGSELAALRTGWMVALENTFVGQDVRLVDVSDAVGEAFFRPIDGWGLAVGDIDRDGDQDVLVGLDGTASADDPDAYNRTLFLENVGQRATDNPSIRVRVRQDGKNPYAVGAQVRLIARGVSTGHLIAAGTGFLSQNEYVVHFGLGDYQTAPAVEVRWPDGERTLFGPLSPGEHALDRPASGNCCVAGECSTMDSESCLRTMSATSGSTAGCDAACAVLAGCCGAVFDLPACRTSCERLPPPLTVQSCLANATCGEVIPCIDVRYLFLDGEGECDLEE